MNRLIELVLEHRGITEADLEAFEDPTHRDLKGVDVLADHLEAIRLANSKIAIIPDFDMDGIMSGTVGYAGLSELGFNAVLSRTEPKNGYGFDAEHIARLLEEHPDVKAIISCDCGISCVDGCQAAIDAGLEVLITDHHIENAETSPRDIVSVIVDPCAIGEEYEHPGICGAHVFWQCLDYYARKYQPEKVDRIWWLRVFAGIGTISDVMPVLYENRALIRDTIKIMQQVWSCDPAFTSMLKDASEPFAQTFRGLYSTYKVFQTNNKVGEVADLTEEFFGFYMAPTFNAVKRMDGEMERAFGVFTSKTPADDVRYLYDLNEQRKEAVAEKYEEILAQDNPYAPYCYVTHAKKGILGLLATKLMGDNNMPCIVVVPNRDGSYSGSGRSPEWFPFLSMVGSLGYRMAGHEGAFGCGFDDEDQLYQLFCDIDDQAKQAFETAELKPETDFVIATDGTGDTGIDEKLFISFVEELETLRPFGRGFEQPKALLRFDAAEAGWRIIGKDSTHLKITLPQGLDVMCWGQASVMDGGIPTGTIEVVGHLDINEYKGKRSAQMIGDVLSR